MGTIGFPQFQELESFTSCSVGRFSSKDCREVGDRETVYVRGTEVLRVVIVRASWVLYIV